MRHYWLVAGVVVLAGSVALAAAMSRTEHARSDFAALDCAKCHVAGPDGAIDARLRPLADAPADGGGYPGRLYRSDTLDATFVALSPTTVACLQCHDQAGSGAPDFARRHGLAGSHPVGYRFDPALAARDRDLRDPARTVSGLGRTVAEDLLEEGTLQCTSCHEFHARSDEATFLLPPIGYQRLCTACHDLGTPPPTPTEVSIK